MVLSSDSSQPTKAAPCINLLGLLMAGALFLVAQAVLIGAWAFIWQKRRQSKLAETSQDHTDRRFFSSSNYTNSAYVAN